MSGMPAASLVALTALAATLALQDVGSPLPMDEAGPAADWEQRADAAIAEHRMADLSLGGFEPGQAVTVDLERHAFPFGSALRARLLVGLPEDDPYKVNFLRLFNHGTLGNYHKWYVQDTPSLRKPDGKWSEKQQNRRAIADAATRWLVEHDVGVSAHAVLWATMKYGVPMPEDVEDLLRKESLTDEEKRYVRDRARAHAEDVVTRHRGQVNKWDVVNEHINEHEVAAKTFDGDPHHDPLTIELFEIARAADPEAELILNDYGILQGIDPPHRDKYAKIIEFLLENDAPVDGIGFQSHYWKADLRLTPEQMNEVLDRYHALGEAHGYDLSLQITEFDMYGDGWGEGEAREAAQAEYLDRFYKVAFAHPAVNSITMWGFWDGMHWAGEAPLFHEDWTPKAALAAYENLLFEEWDTRATLTADADGVVSWRGFPGTYAVTVDGETTMREAE